MHLYQVFGFTLFCNTPFQITPDGFKSLSSGCNMLQTLVLNEFPTLNDDCMMVGVNSSP